MIADYKNPDNTTGAITAWTYLADVKNISNMYPYGKSYGTNATYNAVDDYRYGFNGMEKEKNLSESGDITDFGARVFDANFPTFLSPDPLAQVFPFQSTYLFAENNPTIYIDINGEHAWVTNIWIEKYNSELKLYNKDILLKEGYVVKRISNIYFNFKNVQEKLNRFSNKWTDKNSKLYSPKIADILRNKQVNVVIAQIENKNDNNFIGGITINRKNIILNSELFSIFNGDKMNQLEISFMHEIVHFMNNGEFKAYSVLYSAGLMSREQIVHTYFRTTESLEYLLEGSGIEIDDYFVPDQWDNSTIVNGKKIKLDLYTFKEGKEEEFWELMQKTGEETRGVNEETKEKN